MAKVSKRGGFSDRNGLKSLNTEIQLREIDQRTRIQLQNMISKFYKYVYEDNLYYRREDIQEFLRFVLDSIYSEPIDTRKMYDDDQIIKMIKMTILNDDYRIQCN